jgi:hypothetical protein
MEKALLLTIAVSILFFLIKLVEMKYIDKETKPVKTLIRDTLIVAASTFVPVYLFFNSGGSLSNLLGTGDIAIAPTQIFTDTPGF